MTAVDSEVIVAGAGLAGLVAARTLVAAGVSVIVVEARDRVGGRTLSMEIGGQVIDLGAQWMGDKHDRLRALATELGIESFAQYYDGKRVLEQGGRIRSFSGFFPRVGIGSLAELGIALYRLERAAARVPLDAPLTADGAAELDRLSLADWLDRHVRRRNAREMIELAAQMIFGVEPRELSFLFFLLYVGSGAGLRRLSEIKRGAQERRFVTGAQSISIRIAAELGERIRLEHAVRGVEQAETGVTVHTTRGTLRGQRAILAMPPALLGKLDCRFSPTRTLLHTKMPAGSVIKCVAAYAKPFWREAGYSGEAFSPRGLVRAVFDDCSPDATHAALVAFVVGDAARELGKLPAAERRQLVLGELGRLHGTTAHAPIAYADKDWLADEWSTGCYVGVLAPGALSEIASALRAAEGNIHFAGTETAVHHLGYMEGAIESGLRVADEILQRRA